MSEAELKESEVLFSPASEPSPSKFISSLSNKSFSIQNNLLKGFLLESATKLSLACLKKAFRDYTGEYNLESCWDKSVPDIVTPSEIIEVKNWDCSRYMVSQFKAFNEIAKRFFNFLDSKKHLLLIISKPRWTPGVKAYLKSLGIKIFELGYFVDDAHFKRALHDLIRFFHNRLSSDTSCRSCTSSEEGGDSFRGDNIEAKKQGLKLVTRHLTTSNFIFQLLITYFIDNRNGQPEETLNNYGYNTTVSLGNSYKYRSGKEWLED